MMMTIKTKAAIESALADQRLASKKLPELYPPGVFASFLSERQEGDLKNIFSNGI